MLYTTELLLSLEFGVSSQTDGVVTHLVVFNCYTELKSFLIIGFYYYG